MFTSSLNPATESCSFRDVHRSIKQEVGVGFTYSIHIPSEYSFPASHTQFQLSAPRFKGILIVGWRLCQELWIYCFGEVLNAGNFRPSQLFCDEWGKPKVTWRLELEGEWARTWMFCSFMKVTVTLAVWAWLSFGIHSPPSPPHTDRVDDITFLITSNKHMADDLNTSLCMVRG